MKSPLTRTLVLTPLLLALVAPAAAQQPTDATSKVNLVAQEPLFVAHLDGPDKLRTTFLPTNLGKLFASDEFHGLIDPFLKMLEQMKEQASGQVPIDLDELQKTIQNYSGRLTLAMHVVANEIDFDSGEPPFGFTFILSPDGTTDLKGLCDKCQQQRIWTATATRTWC